MTRVQDNGGRAGPVRLDPSERAFLSALDPNGIFVRTGRDLTRLHNHANRAEDRVRQRCRQYGWAEYVRPKVGVSGWLLTDAGRQALSAPTAEPVE